MVPLRGYALPVLGALLLLVLIYFLASIGLPTRAAGLAAVVETGATAGIPAALWLLGAIGLGVIPLRLLRLRDPDARWSIQSACGLALALFLAHLLGALGAYAWPAPRLVAWLPTAVGLALLVIQLRRAENDPDRWARLHPASLLAVPALALLATAASNPPLALWESEAHAYDVLSYHLQLPKEWIAGGSIALLDHNVYSALPSYVEAAYAQLGVMIYGTQRSIASGEGTPIYAAQLLHAGMALFAAALLARAALLVTRRALAIERDHHGGAAAFGAAVGACSFLLVPWTIVVGSLAYNEMAMIAGLAGALVALGIEGPKPWQRGALCGLLVGAACGAKPTALFLVGGPVGLALVFAVPFRRVPGAIIAGGVAGALVLAPWWVRNAMDAGNPVFPFLASVFGSGHWTGEQVARWNAGHSFDGTLTDRVATLLSRDRGVLHPQYALAFAFCALGAVLAMLRAQRRPAVALLLGGIGIQLLAWLFVGHLQARFLLPVLALSCIVLGIGVAGVLIGRGRMVSAIVTGLVVLMLLWFGAASVLNFASQRDGSPNALLIGGVAELNGSANAPTVRNMSPADQVRFFAERHPAALANTLLPLSGPVKLLLIGDATPLYYTIPIAYATTWDRSLLVELLHANDGDLRATVADLRAAGVTHALVNLSEMQRLSDRGRLDPVLSPALVRALAERHGRIVFSWAAGNRQYLVELKPPEPEGTEEPTDE